MKSNITDTNQDTLTRKQIFRRCFYVNILILKRSLIKKNQKLNINPKLFPLFNILEIFVLQVILVIYLFLVNSLLVISYIVEHILGSVLLIWFFFFIDNYINSKVILIITFLPYLWFSGAIFFGILLRINDATFKDNIFIKTFQSKNDSKNHLLIFGIVKFTTWTVLVIMYYSSVFSTVLLSKHTSLFEYVEYIIQLPINAITIDFIPTFIGEKKIFIENIPLLLKIVIFNYKILCSISLVGWIVSFVSFDLYHWNKKAS